MHLKILKRPFSKNETKTNKTKAFDLPQADSVVYQLRHSEDSPTHIDGSIEEVPLA